MSRHSHPPEHTDPGDITPAAYAAIHGPTVGDRVRLGDTRLVVEIEYDAQQPGNEFLVGFGKTARDGLLLKAALRLSALAKQAADALHQLRLLARLAGLCLLELSHLHGGLSIEASFLEALLRRLHSKLTLLSCELTLQACLLARQLCGLLAKASLLRGRACLELPSLGQLLRRRLAKASLLRGNA
jgi:hypothetical protein